MRPYVLRGLWLWAMAVGLAGCEAVVGVGGLSERPASAESSQDTDAEADVGPVVDDSGLADTGEVLRDSGKATLDSAARDSGSFAVDSSPPSEDAGICAPGSVASYTAPAYVPAVADQGVCAQGDIAAFITACGYGASATPAMCASWQAANVASASAAGTACGNCIMAPANNGGTWATSGPDGSMYYGPNYAGCIQLTDTTQNGTICGAALNEFLGCQDVACDPAVCASDPDASADCYMPADQGACSTYLSSEQSACTPDFGDGGVFDTCHPSYASASLDDDLSYVISLICGGIGAIDSGAPQDGGNVSDAGPTPDGGIGHVDGGSPTDAGPAPDGGTRDTNL